MNGSTDDSPTLMWKPSDVDKTNLDKFRKAVCDKYYLDLETYEELHAWSTERYSNFWEEVWNFTNIKCSKSFDQVIDKSLGIADIPQWFEGSRLNYAENLLKYNDDRIAAYGAREGSDVIVKRTFAQLRDDVEACASAMRRMGVTVGDRVAGYLPNSIETIVAMLAASSIGAVWSSTSPDFGVSGVLDRFTQIKPKLIFSINAVRYNGKVHDHLQKLSSVVQGLPDLDKVVVWQYVTEGEVDTDISKIKNSCTLDEFLASGVDSDSGKPLPLTFEQLPFNHPLFIMYSSGTTGAPKCMVHSAGGTLIKHLEEHVIQGNMTRDTVMMYYTTTGWMMWNWYVTSLAAGAAIVCYDGSPLIPNQNILWDLVDKLGVTTLGTGAKWIAVLEEKNIRPKETHSLSTLDVILSTGSPLKPQSYDYVYTHIKKDLLLGSITGGTDIIACFAGQNCVAPVYRGEIQTRHLGIDLQAWDENGKPVMGESGELVCTKPFPSMPTRFWNDDDGAKYKKAYFEKFDGVWSHGDFVLINPVTKGIWMLGRSDGTLNPSGVRFGSAEIYHIVESFKEIADSLCVGQRSATGDEERVILFLKMAPNSKFDDSLVKRIRTEVRSQLSARHVPALILKIDDIPYTQNAKKVEVAVKKIISGQTVSNRGAYANPESLDLYENIPELQGF